LQTLFSTLQAAVLARHPAGSVLLSVSHALTFDKTNDKVLTFCPS
jgi:hypothetical protein